MTEQEINKKNYKLFLEHNHIKNEKDYPYEQYVNDLKNNLD